ncbi:MAG: PIN domain nuclease [Trueperaceae bacterium]
MILVDTSVWIAYLNGLDTPAAEALHELLAADATVALPTPVVGELLQGTRSEAEADRLASYLATQVVVGPAHDVGAWALAARLYRACRRSGRTVRSTLDGYVAAIAIQRGAPLLHDDRDFDAIAAVDARLRIWPTPT